MLTSLLEGLLVLMLAPALSEPAASAARKSGSGTAPRRVGPLVEESARRISTQSSDRVMLQVEVDCDESSVLRAVSKATPRFPVSIVPVSLGNRSCFRVLVGDFADERTALDSIPLLPSGLISAGDRPRVIALGTLGVKAPIPARSTVTSLSSKGVAPPAPPASAIPPPDPTVVSTTRERDGRDAAQALPPVEPTPVPTVPVTVPRVTPIITVALPVPLPAPMPEPTKPAAARPVPSDPAPALLAPSEVRASRPLPTPAPTPALAPRSAGRVPAAPASVASLQDFARTITFRKEGRKGSLSVLDTGPGSPPPERGKAGPRSEPRISTITKDGPDSFGMIWVSGLIKNSGDAAACTIGVALTLLGPDGRILGSAKAEATQERLNPGESTPFRGSIVPATPILVPVRPHGEITTFTECP